MVRDREYGKKMQAGRAGGSSARERVPSPGAGTRDDRQGHPRGDAAVEEQPRSLFGDLSVTQVAAAALAAVTSMLLSSQVGIAGSLIGAAAGSVIATVSSQVYKTFFSASAEKLKGLHHGEVGTSRRGSHTRGSSRSTTTPHADVDTIRGGHVLSIREERAHRKKVQRNAIIVAICSALVVVALSAIVINVITAGEGVGTKTPTIGFSRIDDTDGSEDSSSGSQGNSVSQDTDDGTDTRSDTGSSTKDAGSSTGDTSQDATQGSSGSQGSSGTQDSTSQDTGSTSGQDGSASSTGSNSTGTGGSGSSSNGSGSTSGTATDGTSSTNTSSAAPTSNPS